MTPTTYRIDYTDADDQLHVIGNVDRHDAQRKALRLSTKHGSAYVIRTDDGADVGQRVYTNGFRSHDDDTF